MVINRNLVFNVLFFNFYGVKLLVQRKEKTSLMLNGSKKAVIQFVILSLITVSTASVASGRFHSKIRSNLVFKAGELKLFGAVFIHTSTFETGKVLKSRDAKIVKETRNIKYEVGKVFGVSIFNIRRKTKLKFKWYYPTILGHGGRNKVSVYSSPEYWVRNKHHIYWSMDSGEKAGRYRLDIFCNGRLVKKTTFHVRK